jgi:hypothetical protein
MMIDPSLEEGVGRVNIIDECVGLDSVVDAAFDRTLLLRVGEWPIELGRTLPE